MTWRSHPGNAEVQVDVGSAERRAAQIESKREELQRAIAQGLRTSPNLEIDVAEVDERDATVEAARSHGARRLDEILAEAGRQEQARLRKAAPKR